MTGPSTTSRGISGTGWPPDEPTPGRLPRPPEPPKRGLFARLTGTGKPHRPAPARPSRPPRAGKPPKPSARPRRLTAAAEAERAARRKGRRNIMVVTGSVGLILLAGAIGFGIWRAQTSSPYPVPANVYGSGNGAGVVAAGPGPVTVDIYADFACAACRSFGIGVEGDLDRMAAAGQITLVYHPLARQDSTANGDYSTRAASAAGCASDFSHLLPFINALWAAEPAGTTGLSDDQIIEVAGSAGIIDPQFARCVRDQRYRGWVGKVTGEARSSLYAGSPTVLVNGGSIAPRGAGATPEELTAAVAAAASNVAAPGK